MSDEDAGFTDFVSARWSALYRTAYLLVPDRGMAEDLVQTALMKTYGAWRRIEPAGAEAYTRQVLVNTALAWFRRRSWAAEQPTEELPERPVAPDEPSWLLAEILRLPDRQRAVVVLRFYEDLSVEDTARLLDISAGTVKSQTHHALARLRDVLGDELVDAVEVQS